MSTQDKVVAGMIIGACWFMIWFYVSSEHYTRDGERNQNLLVVAIFLAAAGSIYWWPRDK